MSIHRDHDFARASVPGVVRAPLPRFVEPTQECEACGAMGTVGRVVFTASHDEREIHRFCVRCWPAEQAWYEALWEDRMVNAYEPFTSAETDITGMTQPDTITDAPVPNEPKINRLRGGSPLLERDATDVTIEFESATWHDAKRFIERFNEQLAYARVGAPSEQQLVDQAVAIAEEMEAELHTRVGNMPAQVAHFLAEFGTGSGAAREARNRREARDRNVPRDGSFATDRAGHHHHRTHEFRAVGKVLDEGLAAAHASADAILSEFDRALDALVVPPTLDAQAAVKKELVDMLQYLEQEIASEAAVLASWQEEMQAAAKAGDAYTAAKLNRLGEERMVRIHGLRASMTDVEVLHHRLLGS